MNSKSIEINIPAEIASLPLNIAEKVVLAHIHNFPGCSNGRLAELIGGTCRGVENLLRRLRQQGYIEESGKGRARRHLLLFHVERHTKGGDCETKILDTKSHTPCGDSPGTAITAGSMSNAVVLEREISWQEDLDETLQMIHHMCVGGEVFPEGIVSLYDHILKRLREEAPPIPERDAMIRLLTTRRDGFFAISVAQRLPRKYQYQAAHLIRTATPEKLAEFRERVLAGQIGDKAPLMLAALSIDIEVEAKFGEVDASKSL